MKGHYFKDETAARSALEAMRWPEGPVCVFCRSVRGATPAGNTADRNGLYRCAARRRDFSVASGTIMDSCSVSICTWMKAAYVFSSSAYREIALLKLQSETGEPEETVRRMWTLVACAVRRYHGYKRGFSQLVQTEMTVHSPRLWKYREAKARLMAKGKHQSQNTIEASGLLRAHTPQKLSKKALDRTECLLRLLLATSCELDQQPRGFLELGQQAASG